MSTTYSELQTKVSRALRDEDNKTFSPQVVKDILDSAWAEISEIIPRRFQQDISPAADTLVYQLLPDDFPDGDDLIEVQRVETWDTAQTPHRATRLLTPQSQHPTGLSYSGAGWRVWNSQLELSNIQEDVINPDTDLIRIWGYSPWPLLVEDDDVVPFGYQIEQAVIIYCYVEGLRRLIGNRVLFTQWQTRSNNTDVTMASLASDFNLALQDWKSRSSRLTRLREIG